MEMREVRNGKGVGSERMDKGRGTGIRTEGTTDRTQRDRKETNRT